MLLVLAVSYLGSDPGNNIYHPHMWTWLKSCWIRVGIKYMREKAKGFGQVFFLFLLFFFKESDLVSGVFIYLFFNGKYDKIGKKFKPCKFYSLIIAEYCMPYFVSLELISRQIK